jgi:hypothetical protein
VEEQQVAEGLAARVDAGLQQGHRPGRPSLRGLRKTGSTVPRALSQGLGLRRQEARAEARGFRRPLPACHRAKHVDLGFLDSPYAAGVKASIRRLAKENGWTLAQAKRHAAEQLEIQKKRSQFS